MELKNMNREQLIKAAADLHGVVSTQSEEVFRNMTTTNLKKIVKAGRKQMEKVFPENEQA